jgi:hypothetical protein
MTPDALASIVNQHAHAVSASRHDGWSEGRLNFVFSNNYAGVVEFHAAGSPVGARAWKASIFPVFAQRFASHR